jgi:hypothetical protein
MKHKTKLSKGPSAARRTTARNAFIVTADVKRRTGNTFVSTQYTHKIYFTVTRKFCAQSCISDKLDIDSSLYNIITYVKDKDVAKHRVQKHFTEALCLFRYYR